MVKPSLSRSRRWGLLAALAIVATAVGWEQLARLQASRAFAAVQSQRQQSTKHKPEDIHYLIGRNPESVSVDVSGRMLELYSWRGLFSRQKLKVEYFSPGSEVTQIDGDVSNQRSYVVFDAELNGP